jgi:hypothetical protein
MTNSLTLGYVAQASQVQESDGGQEEDQDY